MARKPWWSGKTVNPEFRTASRAHAESCNTCGSAPYTSERSHNAWRILAEEHLGKPLPSTFLEETTEPKVNKNVSRVQGNWRNDIITRDKD
jgi:hypothetical protein